VRRFYEMDHFVDDDLYEQVLRLSHKLRIQADASSALIATPPQGDARGVGRSHQLLLGGGDVGRGIAALRAVGAK
jgi:hypothetical protein